MALVLALFASCLGDDDDNLTYYDDTAITSFTLGTLNRTMHTLSSEGEDSTYTDEVDGSDYNFFIDQTTCEIYNPDSLPEGTDNSKVVCTIYSKNSGVVVFKNIDSDTLTYYDSSDSIDFSVPREVRVYSLSGLYYRTYTISVNVHQEDSTSLNWNLRTTDTSAFGEMTQMRSFALDDRLYVFGSDGSQTSAFYAETGDASSWSEASLDSRISSDADAYGNVVLKDGYFYVLGSGDLLRSADASTWEYVSSPEIDKLIARGGEDYLYGMTADGIMISEDNGETWSLDAHDDDIEYLPTEDIHGFISDLATNDDAARVYIVGNRDTDLYPVDTCAVSWGKVEEYDERADAHSWIYQDGSDYIEHALPRMENLTVVEYNDGLLAMGGKGKGGSTVDAYSGIYSSYDQGVSWLSEDYFVYPDDFDYDATCITAVADDDKYLYIICGGTGQVWRGRLNQYAWAEYETTFTE